MARSATNTERPPEWASALRRQMEAPIGWQLGTETKLPQELPPDLTTGTRARSLRGYRRYMLISSAFRRLATLSEFLGRQRR